MVSRFLLSTAPQHILLLQLSKQPLPLNHFSVFNGFNHVILWFSFSSHVFSSKKYESLVRTLNYSQKFYIIIIKFKIVFTNFQQTTCNQQVHDWPTLYAAILSLICCDFVTLIKVIPVLRMIYYQYMNSAYTYVHHWLSIHE